MKQHLKLGETSTNMFDESTRTTLHNIEDNVSCSIPSGEVGCAERSFSRSSTIKPALMPSVATGTDLLHSNHLQPSPKKLLLGENVGWHAVASVCAKLYQHHKIALEFELETLKVSISALSRFATLSIPQNAWQVQSWYILPLRHVGNHELQQLSTVALSSSNNREEPQQRNSNDADQLRIITTFYLQLNLVKQLSSLVSMPGDESIIKSPVPPRSKCLRKALHHQVEILHRLNMFLPWLSRNG